ncbi:sugar phosphate isomerase/epimerase family protein [Roseimaritima sediminicola]|uniref:sugar phosphate isomerase/epimerase family protein n=1 Tax=Roseimaritima sediminicola TaxID=2662066 RepID=UPI00129823C1|nr:sugar phosphate isomerase/epimerase family protein [Roseimaritima sediminicola]
MKRRDLLAAAVAAGVAGTALSSAADPSPDRSASTQSLAVPPLRLCLNTSTLRGQKLTVPEQIRIAAQAGYDAIEPWLGDLQKYVEDGGQTSDLRKQLEDSGLTVESAIGFARWIVDDPEQRAAGLETARRDMGLLAEIGGKRIAAPPVGAHGPNDDRPDLPTIARRYRALLEVGAAEGVVPQLELWGFSPTLSRLGELAYVAVEAGHRDACVLPDFYHIYKGGSDFAGLLMIEASRMHVFHINDYPADPPRETISDKDRVYPGDGVCPLRESITQLIQHGFAGVFSLELFNPQYWQQDALEVAKTGLEKMRAVLPAP